jgi:hypothetical protein
MTDIRLCKQCGVIIGEHTTEQINYCYKISSLTSEEFTE